MPGLAARAATSGRPSTDGCRTTSFRRSALPLRQRIRSGRDRRSKTRHVTSMVPRKRLLCDTLLQQERHRALRYPGQRSRSGRRYLRALRREAPDRASETQTFAISACLAADDLDDHGSCSGHPSTNWRLASMTPRMRGRSRRRVVERNVELVGHVLQEWQRWQAGLGT